MSRAGQVLAGALALTLTLSFVAGIGAARQTAPRIPPKPAAIVPFPEPTLEQQIALMVANMTPEEKAGQLIMVSIYNAEIGSATTFIEQYHFGSVVYLGDGWSAQATASISATLNGLERPHGIGLFIAADCEGGTVQRPYGEGTTLIPPAAAQGQWSNLDLQSAALVWGEELISQGVNLNLAPVTDTVPADNMRANEPIGALGRAFSDNPDVVSEKAKAFILGMQGAGVGTSIKHFPGLGRIKGNTDFTTNGITDSQTTVGDDFVSAFSDALAANPTSVMISLATYTNIDPTTPAVFSPVVIDDLLRRQLGWNGLVIADSLGAAAVANTPADQLARRFVQAGGDISIIPGLGEATAAHAGLVAAINSDPAFAAKVDIAVARVLRSKLDAGLLTLAAIDIAARPTCATPITPEDSRTIVSNANLANRGGRPWQMSC